MLRLLWLAIILTARPSQVAAMEQDARKAQVPLKGRGAASRVPSRFDTTETVGVDDGWESVYHEMEDAPRGPARVL